MVETRHILPPETGPRSNPLLHGVAEALACLFPLDERHFPRAGAKPSADSAAGPEPQSEPAPSAEEEIVPA